MVDVRICKTRADLRAFFKIDRSYLPEEARYIRLNARPEINPLCANGKTAYILALRNDKPVFRAFTGLDEACALRLNERRGYFSLFDGEADSDAAQAVLKEVERLQKSWGAHSVTGPVSFDGSGFFMGAGEGEFEKGRGVFTGGNGTFQKGILLKNGYRAIETDGAYEIEVPDENPFSELCRKVRERFAIEVFPLKRNAFSGMWKRNLYEVTANAPEKDFYRFLEKIERFIAFEHSFITVKNGECTAYVMCMRSANSVARAVTLMTKPGTFTPPAALLLTDSVLTSFRNKGVKRYEASVIDERNKPSFSILSHVNARKTRLYTQFIKNIQ